MPLRTRPMLLFALYLVTASAPAHSQTPAQPQTQEDAHKAGDASLADGQRLLRKQTAESYRQAIESFKSAAVAYHSAGDARSEALALNFVGLAYSKLGEPQKALDYFTQALPLWHSSGTQWGEAATLSNIGAVYHTLGEKQKALDYYAQALALQRAAGDRYGEAKTLSNMGETYNNLGEKQKALDYDNQALPLLRAAGDRGTEATVLINIGAVYDDLGEKQKALDYDNQALPLLRTVGDRGREALTLNNIGKIYNDLGEQQKALDYDNQALPLLRAVGDRLTEATTLNNIGETYNKLGEQQKALDYYAQTLPLRQAVGDRLGEAVTLSNMGAVYDILGEKQKALDYYAQALSLHRTVGDRDGEAKTLENMALVYDHLGEKQKALDYHTQSLLLFHAVQDPLGEAHALVNLMVYWQAAKNPSLAIFFGKQAIDRFQQIRRNIEGLDKETQQSFLHSNARPYRELAAMLISAGRLPEAQQVLDLLKQEEYSEFTQRRGETGSATSPVSLTAAESNANAAYEQQTADLTAIAQQWMQLQAKTSRTAEEEKRYQELSDNLTAANARLQAFLTQLYQTFGQGDTANERVESIEGVTSGLQDLVGELGAGTTGLYTLVLDDKCVIMVITPATRVAHELPITKIALRAKVFDFVTALSAHQSDEDIQAKALDLYNILIAPIKKDLDGARTETLIWSLDDVLRYVPMAALYDGKQYLVERYRSAVITTASIGNLKDEPHVNNWNGLAMGVSKDYDKLGALTAVPGELDSVVHSDAAAGSHGPLPGTILLDDSFTEKSMETALEHHPPLVHIASHYVFYVGDDSKSFLLLGQGFHLTLAEMRADQRLDFRGVELLALSGCQTAVGSKDADGREIDGLGFVAQLKHAKAVVATLWSVDDASVGKLMATFYTSWITAPGITKSEALRQAQLSLLHGTANGATANPDQSAPYANPYYWAPFILIGNWK